MKKLKGYVRNKARPEGCIGECYLAEECMRFCSGYIVNIYVSVILILMITNKIKND